MSVSPPDVTDDEKPQVWDDFNDRVNMTPKELEDWLGTDESKAAGWHGSDGGQEESTGHEMGRHLVEVKRTKKGDLTDEQYGYMKKAVNYIGRHSKQRPDRSDEELADMTWTHSLKNWGHDPLK